MIQAINISETADLITEPFRRKTVTELSGQAFLREHRHDAGKIDCHLGRLDRPIHGPDVSALAFRSESFTMDPPIKSAGEGASLSVGESEGITVPKGTRHHSRVENEGWIFLIEPVGTENNSDTAVDAKDDAPVGAWV
jgi:hypothetical protein